MAPADKGTAKLKESLMNIEPSLVAYGQPTKLVQPCKSTFDHPTVPSQLLAALYPSSGYPWNDTSLSHCLSVGLGVVPLVCMYFVRAFSWSASSALEWWDSIYHLLQHLGVRYVSSCCLYGQRYSASLDHKMALRAWFSLIRRVRPCSFVSLAPFFTPLALTVCESTEALDQPISPASLRLSNNSLCSFFQTPAFCQSLMRLQQVIPEPQPISCGSISHCKPDLSTNTMPVSAARSGMRGLPPLGFRGSGGKSGSIISHNSSAMSIFAIPYFTKLSRFC